MAWKPKLPQVGTEVVPVERRPWIAVAEKNAESAVNLFVHIMKNKRVGLKLRMEAATRIVQIAGVTMRGEKVDGAGRPAANLMNGGQNARLSPDALRQALRQLPPGAVIEAPEEAVEGENYVVLHDGEHGRKPTGHVKQAAVGKLVQGITPRDEAEANLKERLDEEAKKEEEKLAKEPPPPEDPTELMEYLLKKGGNKRHER